MDMSSTIESGSGLEGLRLAREWPAVFMMGLVTLALGVVVISWPQETLKVISVLIGLQILVYGIYGLVSAFAHDTVSPGWTGFVGILGIIVGIVVLRNPFETVAVLAALLGVVWIIGGIIELIGSIADGGCGSSLARSARWSALDRRRHRRRLVAGTDRDRRRVDLRSLPDRVRAVPLRVGVPAAQLHEVGGDEPGRQ